MVSRSQKGVPPTSLRACSGPLLDRIKPTAKSPLSTPAREPDKKLSGDRLGEPSAAIRKRVEAARKRQRARFAGSRGMLANARRLLSNRWPGRRARALAGGRRPC